MIHGRKMRTMRILKSTFFLSAIMVGVFISSCSSNDSIATRINTTTASEVETPTATLTPLPNPTYTKVPTRASTIAPTNTLLPSNEPGLVVTLGEKVRSPWYPGVPVFSPDGQIIALASSRIRLWDISTHQLVREIKNPYPEGCYLVEAKFSPNGKYFASSITGCWEGEHNSGHLLVWDVSTGDLIQEWKQEYARMPGPEGNIDDYIIPVYGFAFLPNTTGVVFASGNTLEIRDILDSEKQDVLKLGPKMYATQISISSDGRLAYIIMSWEKDHNWPALWVHQHKFQVWNVNTHAMLLERKYPEGWVNLSLELLGTRLVQVDFEKNTSQILNLETNDVQDIPFRRGWRYYNSDGSLMVYARLFGFDDDERAIEIWKTDNWRNIYTFTPNFGRDWIYGMHGIAFSPDNTILAIEHQEQVSLWDIRPIAQPE